MRVKTGSANLLSVKPPPGPPIDIKSSRLKGKVGGTKGTESPTGKGLTIGSSSIILSTIFVGGTNICCSLIFCIGNFSKGVEAGMLGGVIGGGTKGTTGGATGGCGGVTNGFGLPATPWN